MDRILKITNFLTIILCVVSISYMIKIMKNIEIRNLFIFHLILIIIENIIFLDYKKFGLKIYYLVTNFDSFIFSLILYGMFKTESFNNESYSLKIYLFISFIYLFLNIMSTLEIFPNPVYNYFNIILYIVGYFYLTSIYPLTEPKYRFLLFDYSLISYLFKDIDKKILIGKISTLINVILLYFVLSNEFLS
jgi:hypothetical protein